LQNAYSYQVAFNPSHFLVEFGDWTFLEWKPRIYGDDDVRALLLS
jgi:hypothetical protein